MARRDINYRGQKVSVFDDVAQTLDAMEYSVVFVETIGREEDINDARHAVLREHASDLKKPMILVHRPRVKIPKSLAKERPWLAILEVADDAKPNEVFDRIASVLNRAGIKHPGIKHPGQVVLDDINK